MITQIRGVFRFACIFIGLVAVLRAEVGDEHLVMGNPSNAVTDVKQEDNYLMRKKEYVLSYNNKTHNANWVSWHLNKGWMGEAEREDDFREDPAVPDGWLKVRSEDYEGIGFDVMRDRRRNVFRPARVIGTRMFTPTPGSSDCRV